MSAVNGSDFRQSSAHVQQPILLVKSRPLSADSSPRFHRTIPTCSVPSCLRCDGLQTGFFGGLT